MKTLYPAKGDIPNPQVQAVVPAIEWHLANALTQLFPMEHFPTIHRWYNCREQGYIVTALDSSSGQKNLNILFYEHRNADIICLWAWEESYFYPPCTWEEVNKPHEHLADKYSYHHSVSYGEFDEAALWIVRKLVEYWCETMDNELFYADYKPI